MVFKRPNSRETGYYFALAQVGVEMAAPIGVGVLLDVYFGWLPWCIIGGAVFGLVAGFVHLISMVRQHDKEDAEQKKRDTQ